MVNHFAAMVLAVGVAAGSLFTDVIINLFTDPPSIVCEEGWITSCERVTGGVELIAVNAPDAVFTFEGLSAEVALGYD